MESKNYGTTSIPTSTGAGAGAKEQQDMLDIPFSTMGTRIAPPADAGPRPGSREGDAGEVERLARRYIRETQLAVEGLLYWGLRWPFELMATLVASGRKWEEESYRPAPKRRVSLYDEDAT